MPVVEIKTVGKLTADQKSEIAKSITDTLQKVAGKDPDSTYVIFDEYGRDEFAWKGRLFSEQ